MKRRIGFVSNSSSTCFICGGYTPEPDCRSTRDICTNCLLEEERTWEDNRFAKWLCNKCDLDYDALYKQYRVYRKKNYTKGYKRELELTATLKEHYGKRL